MTKMEIFAKQNLDRMIQIYLWMDLEKYMDQESSEKFGNGLDLIRQALLLIAENNFNDSKEVLQ